ncbi:ParA family protein [Lusitaniella coriacea LEGE 07157]|uniref:ParA family protein n=1 Tax=Lusitaniella coriacea LEGE 07157 TaxID=945747 RepID=A0A8J7DXH5_9CYAN|nr:ParA family protein [Lusitaniella coriacea LEGE 07157]
MIIGFVNQKGGVGKTTLAAHFAYWCSQKGSAIVIDADAQQSSSNWLKDLGIPCKIVNDPEDLLDVLLILPEKYDAVIVDGPGGMSEVTKAILYGVDVALVPCKPSALDTHSSSRIIRMIRQSQKIRSGKPKSALFLNQAVKGTLLLRDSIEMLKHFGFPSLQSVIYNRQVICDAPGQGTTVWDMAGTAAQAASEDFDALFQEVIELAHE